MNGAKLLLLVVDERSLHLVTVAGARRMVTLLLVGTVIPASSELYSCMQLGSAEGGTRMYSGRLFGAIMS